MREFLHQHLLGIAPALRRPQDLDWDRWQALIGEQPLMRRRIIGVDEGLMALFQVSGSAGERKLIVIEPPLDIEMRLNPVQIGPPGVSAGKFTVSRISQEVLQRLKISFINDNSKIGGFCRKFRFWGKIQKSGINNSMTYRPQNSRKSKFATEPFELGGTEALETPALWDVPEIKLAGGLDALRRLGAPVAVMKNAKERLFAA